MKGDSLQLLQNGQKGKQREGVKEKDRNQKREIQKSEICACQTLQKAFRIASATAKDSQKPRTPQNKNQRQVGSTSRTFFSEAMMAIRFMTIEVDVTKASY